MLRYGPGGGGGGGALSIPGICGPLRYVFQDNNSKGVFITIVVTKDFYIIFLHTYCYHEKVCVISHTFHRCVKAVHGHFRDDFNVSIIHQSDEFGCFWVNIGSFIRNMTSSGLFTKTIRLLNRNFLLNT